MCVSFISLLREGRTLDNSCGEKRDEDRNEKKEKKRERLSSLFQSREESLLPWISWMKTTKIHERTLRKIYSDGLSLMSFFETKCVFSFSFLVMRESFWWWEHFVMSRWLLFVSDCLSPSNKFELRARLKGWVRETFKEGKGFFSCKPSPCTISSYTLWFSSIKRVESVMGRGALAIALLIATKPETVITTFCILSLLWCCILIMRRYSQIYFVPWILRTIVSMKVSFLDVRVFQMRWNPD